MTQPDVQMLRSLLWHRERWLLDYESGKISRRAYQRRIRRALRELEASNRDLRILPTEPVEREHGERT